MRSQVFLMKGMRVKRKNKNPVMGSEIGFGRGMLQNKPLVKNLTIFSRNTIPLYDIILYYIIYLCTHKKAICAKCTKSAPDFVQNAKN